MEFLKVSSTLGKEFHKGNMFKEDMESCWNSKNSSSVKGGNQWIILENINSSIFWDSTANGSTSYNSQNGNNVHGSTPYRKMCLDASVDTLGSLNGFHIQFQGGFSCERILVYALLNSTTQTSETLGNNGFLYNIAFEPVYPLDSNNLQSFDLTPCLSNLNDSKTAISSNSSTAHPKIAKLCFQFLDSTDTYGRIIIYRLKLYS